MHEASTQGTFGGELTRKAEPKKRLTCPRCMSDKVYRLYREGFLQKRIYSLFGFYPWRCKVCSAHMMLHRRRIAKRKHPGESA
jgi:hypothetical protein